MSFLGLLALVLECVGLYSIMAHAVVRRPNEIGIRMALGANPRHVIRLVLRESLTLILIGVAIGVPAALGAAKLVSSQLFGISAADPATLVMAAGLLTFVAALAGYVPARTASRAGPLAALRYA